MLWAIPSHLTADTVSCKQLPASRLVPHASVKVESSYFRANVSLLVSYVGALPTWNLATCLVCEHVDARRKGRLSSTLVQLTPHRLFMLATCSSLFTTLRVVIRWGFASFAEDACVWGGALPYVSLIGALTSATPTHLMGLQPIKMRGDCETFSDVGRPPSSHVAAVSLPAVAVSPTPTGGYTRGT